MANKTKRGSSQVAIGSSGSQINGKSLLKDMQVAQKTGILNLANREFDCIPVTFMSDDSSASVKSCSFDNDSPRWWEVADIKKIFLQCNKLSNVPMELLAKVAHSLTVLDVHENNIGELSVTIGDLQVLQSFNVNHNKLRLLPATFVNLQCLSELNLANNQLTELPLMWGSLTSLTLLNLSNNELTKLPESFTNCSNLITLDLSHNRLQQLPAEFLKLCKLQSLDLSFNKIASSNFSALEQLRFLKIDCNCLTCFPDLNKCCLLKELSACDNMITKFDLKNTESLRSISILNLRGNRLSHIPDDIAVALCSIERLDLANNDLSTLPNQFGITESLKVICLDGNPLRSLRRDIVSRGTVFIKQWLASRLPETQTSQVFNQKEPALNTKDGDKVDLSNCGSENVTSLLQQASPYAKEIIISKNRLPHLDGIIGSFVSIKFLDLSCNLLTSLPAEIASLANLQQLNISANRFAGSLPDVIYTFRSLEVLIVANNALEKIDMDRFSELSNLSVFDMRNNNFSQLSPVIATLRSLKHLEVTGNPFKVPRPEIVAKGSNAILDYLRSKLP